MVVNVPPLKNRMRNYLSEHKPMFAFNIWDINSAEAVLDGAVQCGKDIILQTSASVFETLNKRDLREFVNSYIKKGGISVWLHLDHCRDMKLIWQAIEYGWDSVMIDASDKMLDENINITNQVIKYAHERQTLVEAEVGQVKGVEDDIIVKQAAVASREEINRFLTETDVDMIAVAFGNAHGVYEGEPELHYDLVEYTVHQSNIPFVVHGGSGLSDEMLLHLLSMPKVKKINISTEVKLAYREGILQAIERGLLEQKDFQAAKVAHCIHNAIVNMVESKLKLVSD